MPSAIKYIPPTDERRNDWNTLLYSEKRTRLDNYKKAVKYYLGEQQDQLAYNSLQDEIDDNVHINLIRLTADRTATFLFPQLPNLVTDVTSASASEEEVFLQDWLVDNGGVAFLVKWAIRGFLAGHSFIRVKIPNLKRKEKYPRMSLLHPSQVTVFWRADDEKDIVWYENRYKINNIEFIEDYVQQEDGTWVIYTYQGEELPDYASYDSTLRDPSLFNDISGLYNNNWKLINKAIHKSHIPPIVDTPHLPHPNDFYGLAEVENPQIELQDIINRVASRIQQITRETADPVDILFGTTADEIEEGRNVIAIPNAQAKVQRLEYKSDMPASKSLFELLVEHFLAVSRVVILKGEAKDLQRVTNAAVRTLFLDALAKNAILQENYGASLSKIAMLALEMTNKSVDKVRVLFKNPLPEDMTETANFLTLISSLGAMSRQTAAERAGLNWTEEKARLENERTLDIDGIIEEDAKPKETGTLVGANAPVKKKTTIE